MDPDLTLTAAPSPCEYLPNQIWRIRHELYSRITPQEYLGRLEQGWRRFGHVLFRPECPECRACRSLRVPVASFAPSESQRRAWRKNLDLTIRIGAPTSSSDRLQLFDRYHRRQHEAKQWPMPDHSLEPFLRNPFATEEWTYRAGDRLIAVGYVDVLPQGLSAIYFFYDPDERRRSLGTFNVLAIIESARRRALPYVYLGYYVEGCASLEYKARFRPNEVLGREGWEAHVR